MQLGLESETILAQLTSTEEELACLTNLRAIIIEWHRMLVQAGHA
jgi:hypothetical protein